MGEAVTAEGLFTTALDHFSLHVHFANMAHVFDYAQALEKYQELLQNWDKRQTEAAQVQVKAKEMVKQGELLQGIWKYPLSSLMNIPFLR